MDLKLKFRKELMQQAAREAESGYAQQAIEALVGGPPPSSIRRSWSTTSSTS